MMLGDGVDHQGAWWDVDCVGDINMFSVCERDKMSVASHYIVIFVFYHHHHHLSENDKRKSTFRFLSLGTPMLNIFRYFDNIRVSSESN